MLPMSEPESENLAPVPKCLWCGQQMQSVGVREFRTGGTTGGWKLVFGEWAELGEGMMSLEVLACPVCRRVDFRAGGSAGAQ